MHKCDCLYRESSWLKKMVSVPSLGVTGKDAYEALLCDKNAIIAQKEAKICRSKQRISCLERQLYRKKTEKSS